MFQFKRGYICCGCERRFSEENAFAVYKKNCLCTECSEKLNRIKPASYMEGTKNTSMLIAPFVYDGLYREIFLKFKFGGNYAYGHLMGMAAAEYFTDLHLNERYEWIIPVPLSKERLNERGFNQSEIIARYIAEAAELPIKKYLVRNKHCVAQSSLQGAARAQNVEGVFSTNANLDGRRVIVLDDIFTTGSTVNECAKVLKKAGAKEVCVICAAKTDVKKSYNPAVMYL